MFLRPVCRAVAVAATATLTLFTGSAALADNVTVDGDTVATTTTDIAVVTCPLPVSRAGQVEVKRTGGPTAAHFMPGETLTITITDSSPQVATTVVGGPVVVPPGFTENGATSAFTFNLGTTISAGADRGSTSVTIAVSSPSYTAKSDSFGVSWNCGANTPPTVTMLGVADGESFEFGNEPLITCSRSDTQDGDGTVTPAVTALSGPRADDGLGSRTATCSFTDSSGLTGTASATYQVVDTTAPYVAPPSHLTVEATSASGAIVEFTEPSGTDAVDDQVPARCAPAPGSVFPLGSTTVSCTATDREGNAGTASFTVDVADTSRPQVTVPESETVAATGASGAAFVYSASATDTVDGVLTPSCLPASGATFALGATTVVCTATDAAGNTGTNSFVVTVQDQTAPDVKVPPSQVLEATGPGGAPASWAAATATDAVDGPLSPTCSRSSGATFTLGTTTVTCSATDAAGNTGSASFSITVEDTSAPALTVPGDLTAEATGQLGAPVTFEATATDVVDGPVAVSCTPASGAAFALGETTVLCTTEDSRGNSTSTSFTVTVVDTTPPAMPNLATVAGVEATGPSGAVVDYSVGTAMDIVSGELGLTCTPASGSTFALGTTAVDCTATDRAGNTGRASFTVAVVDTTAPVLADMPGVTEEARGPAGATVSYPLPPASDLVDPSPAVTCTPAPGSTFRLGPTTVGCTASDASGNKGTSSFVVTVQDTTRPTLVDMPGSVTVEATGPGGADHSWSDPTGRDAVDENVEVSCAPPSGSTFSLGATLVTCTATDDSGNAGTGGFMVTVEDTRAPDIPDLPNLTTTATSAAGAVVAFDSPTAVDVVDGEVETSCAASSGSVFPLGTNTVSCRATDAAGNTSTKSFTVTVIVPWTGVLTPVTDGGTYKLGSTIPVKFSLTGTAAGITRLPATLWVHKSPTAATGATAAEAVSTSAATTGNLFRYSEGQYIFNLNTKPLAAGTYELLIGLGDGVPHAVVITLR